MEVKLNPMCSAAICCDGHILPLTVYMSISHSGNGPCQAAEDNSECEAAASMSAYPMTSLAGDPGLPASAGFSYFDQVGDLVQDFCHGLLFGMSCSEHFADGGNLISIGCNAPHGVAPAIDTDTGPSTLKVVSCKPLHVVGTITVPATASPGNIFVGNLCRYNMDGGTDEETFTIEITE